MKKFFLFTFFSMITSLGMAQGIDISGTVTDDDGPLANADVYIMTISNVVEPVDTVGTTSTNENGNFNLTLELEDDSLFLVASSSACPLMLSGFVVIDNEASVLIDCGGGLPGDSIPESLYIGGVPVNFEGDEWYFFSSVFGEAVSYSWTINGNNFNTHEVTYQFPGPGTYTASLDVEMGSGNILSDEMEVNVIEIPNCVALFFPFVDSLNADELVFINASIGDDLSYFWDFGDGNTSTEQFPTHQYEDSLEYEICLTITGENCDDSFCLTISAGDVIDWNGSGIIAGRTHSEAKDGEGFEFVVVPPPGNPLSTQNLEFDVELNMYPNPTDGIAFVNFYSEKSESAQLRLLDITGKLVVQENVSINSGENNLNLDFSQLTEGVYIMFFESASNQRGVTKVVIQ